MQVGEMRNIVITAFACLTVGLVTRPASAQWGPPGELPADTGSPPAEAAPGQATAETAQLRELRGLRAALYAREAVQLSGSRILQGDLTVRPATFYALAGRPDLVSRIRQRRAAKGVTIGIGAAALGLGATVGILDSASTSASNGANSIGCTFSTDPNCRMPKQASDVPWAVAALGGVTMVAGLLIPTDPLDVEEKRALVDDYNRRAWERTGLSSALESAKRTARIDAAVAPGGQSGMAVASCSF
jgi:hypothetical protein